MMKISLKFNRSTNIIEIPKDATVQQLKDEIFKRLNIPVDSQKIINKGQPLTENDKKLSEFNIRNGTKLFLVASEPEATSTEASQTKTNTSSIYDGPPAQPDKAIVELGPPPGALKGFQTEVSALPQEPFIIRTSKGIATLRIETDALFIEYNKPEGESSEPEMDRIFNFDIKGYSTDRTEKNGYFHLCLQTTTGSKIFYFLPNQYYSVITKIIESYIRYSK